MFEKIKNIFTKPVAQPIVEEKKPSLAERYADSDSMSTHVVRHISPEDAHKKVFQRSAQDDMPKTTAAMDSAEKTKVAMDVTGNASSFDQSFGAINPIQFQWYASNFFIGYQNCAMMCQNWLIDKACKMPADDAARNGYKITVNDGTDVESKVFDAMYELDEEYEVNKNLIEFIQMGRIFGIRIAMFVMDVKNPDEYYGNPFNPDGILPGTYRGISQIDPYWITPELDSISASRPGSIGFYEPTYWRISGLRIHKSHLVIFRTGNLPDILKPTYYYGGISVPQKIYERIYCAERTANEAPLLALTKRTKIQKIDIAAMALNQAKFKQRQEEASWWQDNYGTRFIGLDETVEQHDTSLTDLDAAIMTQYQLAAAIAEVPATKLLGTSPKGFNATGEFEMKSYHEKLKSTQGNDMSPLLERHHVCVIRSDICKKFDIPVFKTKSCWNPLDNPTTLEKATINKMKAETDNIYIQTGAFDGLEIREKTISDPESEFNGLQVEPEPEEIIDEFLDTHLETLIPELENGEENTIAQETVAMGAEPKEYSAEGAEAEQPGIGGVTL